MPRLRVEFLERVESFCDRVLDLTDALERQRRPKRIVDQVSAAGTSVGANLFEASQAMSKPDFCRCCAIAAKELSETMFWLRLVARREWVKPKLLDNLEAECLELQKIIGTMIARTKPAPRQRVRSG